MATKIIVGFGNPGVDFEQTPHNAGFRAIDLIQQELYKGGRLNTVKSLNTFWAAEYIYRNTSVWLIKPLRYMNLSGTALYEALSYLQLSEGQIPDDLLILHDELDIEAGKIKVVENGNPGNNNGCKNFDEVFDRKGYWHRVKIGAKPLVQVGSDKASKVAYVIGKMTEEQAEQALKAETKAKKAALKWVTHGITSTMGEFNQKEK